VAIFWLGVPYLLLFFLPTAEAALVVSLLWLFEKSEHSARARARVESVTGLPPARWRILRPNSDPHHTGVQLRFAIRQDLLIARSLAIRIARRKIFGQNRTLELRDSARSVQSAELLFNA
jgi:hypothetical protein